MDELSLFPGFTLSGLFYGIISHELNGVFLDPCGFLWDS